MLLVKGAHIDEVDYKRRNALHNFAAASRDDRVSGALSLEIVAHLLQAGVNVDATDELGRTALHWSTVTDNIELMRLLLTTRFRGASPKARTNAVDKRMKTSLHLAASHDRFHMAEILLQHGADVHAVYDGPDPLLSFRKLTYADRTEGGLRFTTPVCTVQVTLSSCF